jgi:hypothetical protein
LNVFNVVTSRKMRWAWHVARVGEKRNGYRVLVGNLEERDHLEDLHIEG